MVSYEVFMGLSLMGIVMMTGSFSLVDIVKRRRMFGFASHRYWASCFCGGRHCRESSSAFRFPEAEHELTAGFHTEYGGMKFAMFMLGEYLGLILISCMITTLFFGGWLGPALIGHWLPPFVWFGLKVFLVICFLCSFTRGDPQTSLRPADVTGLESHVADHASQSAGDWRGTVVDGGRLDHA